jgi:potassium efflux system protein
MLMIRAGVVPLALLLAAAASARAARGDSRSVTLTLESVRAEIAETEAATGMGEETKAALLDTYRKALTHLQAAAANKESADEFRRAREEAPQQAEALRAKLDGPPKPIKLGVATDAPLAEIEQTLLQEQANLAAVEAKLSTLEDELAAQSERPTEIRQRLTEAKRRLGEIDVELRAPAPTGKIDASTKARQAMLKANVEALNAEIRMLDEELLSQPMRLDLLQAQRDEQALNVERIAERQKRLAELVAERRRTQTEEVLAEAEAARLDAEDKHPLVRELVARNGDLGRELATLTADAEKTAREESTAAEQAKRISEEFRSVRQKLDVAGLSQALGMVLLEQRRALPDLQVLRKRAAVREDEIAVAGLRQIQHEEERRNLRNVDGHVAKLTERLPAAERQAVAAELKQLVDARRELLSQAIAMDRAYLRALGDLEFAQRQLIDVVASYQEYLAGRLLWIRSAPPPSLGEVKATATEAAVVLSPAAWWEVAHKLAVERIRSPGFLLLLILFGILLWKQRGLWDLLRATSEHIGRPKTDGFSFTLYALLYTVLLALPWPLLILTIGWQLGQGYRVTEFCSALSDALVWAAPPLFSYRFARVLCHSQGLASRHLGWSGTLRESLRRALDRLAIGWIPAGMVAVFFLSHRQVTSEGGGIERLGLMIATLALGAFLYALLHPGHGILLQLVGSDRTTLAYRLRYVWFAVALAFPLALLGLAILGYLYTAGVLAGSLARMVWFLFLLLIAHELAVRWLTVTHRRLAYKARLERRQAALAAAEDADASAGSETAQVDVEEAAIDLAALSDEARKLLNAALLITACLGLWAIWGEALPALSVLDEVILWERVVETSGEPQRIPTTLGDLLIALIIGIVTIVGVRRLPSLAEIVLLQHLQMSPAGHYTANTLSRYVIAAVGIVLAVGRVGFNWSQVQWLVAALGVGIGFGLQEIVANFISGLIILFEQPIRVGDIVTVGDTDGVVTRIRIRATTIRTWDRKELLVPNKEFVTGRLLNWSLSDQITRIVIRVGIAYGSEVQKAMRLMSEAAEENRRVLDDPKPFVAFDGFGDNALSLTLRCFVAKVDERLDAVSEIHQTIHQRFNESGISIAFPQRDVHLDASQPLEVRLMQERRGGSP